MNGYFASRPTRPVIYRYLCGCGELIELPLRSRPPETVECHACRDEAARVR